MGKLRLWQSGKKTKDFDFIDRTIAEQMKIGGIYVNYHKLLYSGTDPNAGDQAIQDPLWLENRDRKYDDDIYEIPAVYTPPDNSGQGMDLTLYGIYLPNDIIFLTMHQNMTVDLIGRRPQNGDVVEFLNLRDDLVNPIPDADAVNKFYVVQDVVRTEYSATWYSHCLAVKLSPITDSQEFADIFKDKNALSQYDKDIAINDAWMDQAEAQVLKRNFRTEQYWVYEDYNTLDTEHSLFGSQYRWIYGSNAESINNKYPVVIVDHFPANVPDNTWVLHTGYQPETLFVKQNSRWRRVNMIFDLPWKSASRDLETFINNDTITTFGNGEQQTEKQMLSKAITRRDYDDGRENWMDGLTE
jgi:hypothetical protein